METCSPQPSALSPEPFENLLRVLAERRRRQRHLGRRPRQPHHRRQRLDRADLRMLLRHHESRAGRPADAPALRRSTARGRTARSSPETARQLLDGELAEDGLDQCLERVAVGDAIRVRLEPRIVAPLGPLDRLAEADPQRGVGDGDDDQSVLRAQRLVRRDVEVIVADAARRRAGRQQHRHRQPHHRQHRLEQRDVDVLAEAAACADRAAPAGCPASRTGPAR